MKPNRFFIVFWAGIHTRGGESKGWQGYSLIDKFVNCEETAIELKHAHQLCAITFTNILEVNESDFNDWAFQTDKKPLKL